MRLSISLVKEGEKKRANCDSTPISLKKKNPKLKLFNSFSQTVKMF